jgi:type I restriction enzyme S subunit
MSWSYESIGSLVKITKGKKHTPIVGGQFKYINIEDLHNPENFISTNTKGNFVNEEDLIIAWDGANAGKVGIGYNGVIGSTLAKLSINSKDINPKFLFWFLEMLNPVIKSQRTGATIPHVNGGALKQLQVPLPPLPIQKRIAEILDAADALKRKDQELLKKYDQLAQAIFIDMFGDPVKNEKGWELTSLGSEMLSIRYGAGSTPTYSESGVPFIRATNIKGGRIVKKGMVYLSTEEAFNFKKCYLNEGNLIIVRSGVNTGDCAYITKEYANSLGGFDLIVEMDDVKSYFYNYFLNSIWGKSVIEKLSRRAGQPHLNSEQVKNITCIAPKYSTLQKFKQLMESIEILRSNSLTALEKNKDLFDSLIKKAFKGDLVEVRQPVTRMFL